VNVVAMIGIVGAEAAVAVAVLVITPYAGTELLNVPAFPHSILGRQIQDSLC
jgi:hypothetical protein